MSEIKRRDIAKVDLSKPMKPETLGGVYALFDNGPTLVTEIYRDGEAVDLTGCEAVAYFTNAAGKSHNLTGTIEGNTITVLLNAVSLDVRGRFTVSIQLRKSNLRQTVRIVRGYLYGTVSADHWMGVQYKSAMQTGANEVTLTFTPYTADVLTLWEVFEVVDGAYINRGTAMVMYTGDQFTWYAELYDVAPGQHTYCLRGTRDGVIGEYTQTVQAYVDANWTA